MPTSKTSHYDVAIIGAGINGCTSAYLLSKAGLNVVLIDRQSIAAGGSGAAGAFISPKFTKDGPLKTLMQHAHDEAIDFYATRFPEHTLLKPLLHIAKNQNDADAISHYKHDVFTHLPDTKVFSVLQPEAKEAESVYLQKCAVVDAQGICHAMTKDIEFVEYEVKEPKFINGQWRVNDHIQATHLVLAIGAYPKILPIPYLTLRGIWGHRIDVETSTHVPIIFHHHVSVSPTNQEGVIAIGATHNVHYSPLTSKEPYDIDKGRVELLQKASMTLKLNNIKVLKDYMGLRSGSNDYLPMLGPLVDAEKTLMNHPHLQHGKSVSSDEFTYYPNLTMVNGSGGYGFVLAPYLAKRLTDLLAEGEKIDPSLSPSRFFSRWVKRKKI